MATHRQDRNEAKTNVDFIYGLGSRYSYLASTQIARVTRETGARFCWQPISSHALLGRRRDNPFRGDATAGQYDWGYRKRDAQAWARYYGVPFNDPIGRLTYEPMLPALAAMAADRQGQVEAMSHLLYRMIFADDRVKLSRDQVVSEAGTLGLDLPRFEADLTSPELAMAHERRITDLESRGVFGVPTFLYRDELYWGNDRLVLLVAALRS